MAVGPDDATAGGADVTCAARKQGTVVLSACETGQAEQGQGDEMVGLISIGDVVKARLAELTHEKDALESMIKGF